MAQETLIHSYGDVLVCLICGKDGVAGLNMQEFRMVLEDITQEQGIITVRRRLGAMYHVKGRDGELKNKIGRQDIFEKIQHMLHQCTVV